MKPNTDLNKLIADTKGKFFSITFIKKDGSERTANGKDFYHRLQHGGQNKVAEAGYTSLVDRNKEDWIAAKGERVKSFKCGQIKHTF